MDRKLAERFLEKMLLARTYEETVIKLASEQKTPGTCTSVGQEASAIGVIQAIGSEDIILTNHRSASHILARGAEPKRCLAEVMGKETGYCKGRSGTLHISIKELGVYLTSTIVGGELSLVTGVALSQKMLKTQKIVVCFFGDGAACEGVFHESLNLAAVWDLPILYVCENNQWQAYVSRKKTMKVNHISEWASRYQMPAVTVDGNDVEKVYEEAKSAVDFIRSGEGPYFLECYTYRQRGHFEPDSQWYVDKEELEHWKTKDPISNFKAKLVKDGVMNEREIQGVEQNINGIIEEAVQFATDSPYPNPEDIYQDVYA